MKGWLLYTLSTFYTFYTREGIEGRDKRWLGGRKQAAESGLEVNRNVELMAMMQVYGICT